MAAVNGPRSCVLAGGVASLDAAVEELTAEGVRVRRVPVDYASHSPHVDRVREELLAALAPVRPLAPQVTMMSSTTAAPVVPGQLDAEYWYENLRRAVRFEDATRALLDGGHGVFVEVSSHPVLVPALQQTAETVAGAAVVTGTLRREEGGLRQFAVAAAQLYVQGVPVDLGLAFDGARTVDLPVYPFQRRRYWLDEDLEVGTAPPVPAEPMVDAGGLRLAGLDRPARVAALVELVRTEAAAVLGHDDAAEIQDDSAFFDVGFASITAVELRNRLGDRLGRTLPTMLLFDHPTPAMVADHLADLPPAAGAGADGKDDDAH